MPESFKRLYQGQLPTAQTVIYTVPALTSAVVKSMRVVNNGSLPSSFAIWQGGLGAANQTLPPVTLQPGEFAEFDGSIFMAAADTMAAQAGVASTLTMTVWGVELT